MAEPNKYDVFISYSRKDYVDEQKNVIPGNVVSQVKDALTAAGISYWFDEEGIYSGQNFVEKIVTSIEAAEIFIFLSTENANKSPWTCKEIASAAELGKHIIPVRIDETPYNKKVLFRIADLDYIEYYVNPEKGLADLLDAVKVHLEQTKQRTSEGLKKIIAQQKSQIEDLQRKLFERPPVDGKPKKGSKKIHFIYCAIILLAFIGGFCYFVNSSQKYNIVSYQLKQAEEREMQAGKKLYALSNYTPFIITDIEIKNDGESWGDILYQGRTTFLIPRIQYIGIKSGSYNIGVKIYGSQDSLIQGTISPNGYSYFDNVSITKDESFEDINGWGHEEPGYWSAGTYRIEIWYKERKMAEKTFYIY